MSRTILVDLSPASIKAAAKELRDYAHGLQAKADAIASRLASMGATNVSIGFARAYYDGPKDVVVTVEQQGPGTYAIVAAGTTVLIIEFGAGVTMGYGHPEPGPYGPGTYPGQKRAMNPNGWWFKDHEGETEFAHHTYGNPPSMTMYLTAKDLRAEIERVVQEVFNS